MNINSNGLTSLSAAEKGVCVLVCQFVSLNQSFSAFIYFEVILLGILLGMHKVISQFSC